MPEMPESRLTFGRVAVVIAAVLVMVPAVWATVVGLRDGGSATPSGGATASASATTLTSADKLCRSLWADLGNRVARAQQEGTDVKAAFASRWNSIAAGIDYYSHTGKGPGCQPRLDAQRSVVTALEVVTARAGKYDAGARLATALAARDAATKKLTPAARAAYRTLVKQSPVVTKDLAPALGELAQADPTDAKAVRQAFDDLALLAETSDAETACVAALKVVDPKGLLSSR